MNTWLLILAMAIVTAVLRLAPAFAVNFGDRRSTFSALANVPALLIAAMLGPMIFFSSGRFDPSLGNSHFVAAVPCALTAFYTRSVTWTVIVGCASAAAARALGAH